MLQNGGIRAGDEGARADAEHDVHLALVDLDPLHQRPYDTTLALPIQVIEVVGYGRGEVVQVADNQPQIALCGSLLSEVFGLRFEDHYALFEVRDAGLEFALLDEPLG